jgi:general secretion pathway protein E
MLDSPQPQAALSDRPTAECALTARLIAGAKLDPAGAERAQRLVVESGRPLAAVLASLGLVGERDIAEALAEVLGIAAVRASEFPEIPALDEGVSPKFLREARVLALGADSDGVILAMADPLDGYTIRALEMRLGRPVRPQVATPSDIEAAYERWSGLAQQAAQDAESDYELSGDERLNDDIDRLRDLASEAPVIRLVNSIIARAIEARASDIHIEPFGSKLLVRTRIDGVMQENASPPPRLQAAVISRIKIMARMNIAERRLPQDGRIRFTTRGRDYDLRVSSMPTLHGEAVVIRVLDRASLVSDFSELGFETETETTFLDVLSRPQGITLVTGPTGSGKTTTLYAALMQLNDPGRKLFTIEDPIEYELEGVNQVQVKAQIDLGFARILRAILRHDPDVVMIGEIRDTETANVAAQASLTGHTVLSTLHTNDAPGAVTRLLDMGVEPYLVTSTLNAVLAQRLVRKLCTQCRMEDDPPPGFLDEHPELFDATFYRPGNCEKCNHRGFHGRMAITELLVMSDEIRRLVNARADAREIAAQATAEGMRTMYADGLVKAQRGLTTLNEVLRVTREG